MKVWVTFRKISWSGCSNWWRHWRIRVTHQQVLVFFHHHSCHISTTFSVPFCDVLDQLWRGTFFDKGIIEFISKFRRLSLRNNILGRLKLDHPWSETPTVDFQTSYPNEDCVTLPWHIRSDGGKRPFFNGGAVFNRRHAFFKRCWRYRVLLSWHYDLFFI